MYTRFIKLTEIFGQQKREIYLNASHIRIINRSPDMKSTRIRFSADAKDSIDVEEALTDVMAIIDRGYVSERH